MTEPRNVSDEPVPDQPTPWRASTVIGLVGAVMGAVGALAAVGTLTDASDPTALEVRLQACACLGVVGTAGGLVTRRWISTAAGFLLAALAALLLSLTGSVASAARGGLSVLVGVVWVALAAVPLVLVGVIAPVGEGQTLRARAVTSLVGWVFAGVAVIVGGFVLVILWLQAKTENGDASDYWLGISIYEKLLFVGALGLIAGGAYWWLLGLSTDWSLPGRRRPR
jgi:hypothetical protein